MTDKKACDYSQQVLLHNESIVIVSVDSKSSVKNDKETIPETPIGTEQQWTTRTKCVALGIIAFFGVTDFSFGLLYSVIAPFFPRLAESRHASATETGAIFGVFEFVGILVAPVLGLYLTNIGSKFTYISGLFLTGTTCILFGFMENTPAGSPFVALGISIRLVEGLGCAAYVTAAFSMVANLFPGQATSAFGFLEMTFSIGQMVGPLIGGALYEAGGFKFPFLLLGGIITAASVLALKIVPSSCTTSGDTIKTKSKATMVMATTSLTYVIMYIPVVIGVGAGFLNSALSLDLERFELSATAVGAVFVGNAGAYALSTPMWGAVVDRWPSLSKPILLAGMTLSGVVYQALGPSPLFPFLPRNELWLIVVAIVADGLFSSVVVAAFPLMFRIGREAGLEQGLDTYGVVSGLYMSTWQLGGFIGPIFGGMLVDLSDFATASSIIGGIRLSAAVFLALHCVYLWCKHNWQPKHTSIDEKKPLLED